MDKDQAGFNSDWPELQILEQNQEKTLDLLRQGDITDVSVSCKKPVDCVVDYLLEEEIISKISATFPDPRKTSSVPLDVMLLGAIIQNLNNDNSLISMPYLLNDSSVMTKLGHNFKVVEKGFNNQNKNSRKVPYHGDTLRHLLLNSKVGEMIDWFNKKGGDIFKKASRGRTRQYIMDGTKIRVPKHLAKDFQESGKVKNNEGEYEYGYKVVWIYEIIDRKGVIRALKVGRIEDHDIKLGRELVKEFDFEPDSLLVMDRGFWDSHWVKELHEDRNIDICMPLKKNLWTAELAIHNKNPDVIWKKHPTREFQEMRALSEEELEWEDCPIFNSGVVVKSTNTTTGHVVFVDTRPNILPETILETYNQRWEIEEAHRQMKMFQNLEGLKSKKYVSVVFRIIIVAMSYNMFTLFLNSEGCKNLKEFTIKLFRQTKSHMKSKDVEMIIYADKYFAVIKCLTFFQLILGLPDKIQKKLQGLFSNWDGWDTS